MFNFRGTSQHAALTEFSRPDLEHCTAVGEAPTYRSGMLLENVPIMLLQLHPMEHYAVDAIGAGYISHLPECRDTKPASAKPFHGLHPRRICLFGNAF